MQRKHFLQSSLLGGASLLTTGIANASPAKRDFLFDDKYFHLNYGIHDGMFKNHAGDDFVDQIKFAYYNGFRAIEDNGMMKRTPAQQQKIGDVLAKLGMATGVFVLDKGGNGANTLAAGKSDYVDVFLNGCHRAVETSKNCGGKLTTVVPEISKDICQLAFKPRISLEALRRGVEILEPHGIVMVLEPLSDTPDLFLRTSDQAYAICKAIKSPSCKILFDMFHIQRNSGNLIQNIDWVFDEISYFQIGNNPGRNEPGTGEMDYKNIFKHIYEKGFKGILGMEHGTANPGKEGEAALIRAYRDADSFV